MIVIGHARFLSTRFDLVVRYYLLEKHGFNAQKAGKSIVKDVRYKHLRSMYGRILKEDSRAKRMRKVPESLSGRYVAEQLFHMPRWSWIEKRMVEGDKWIRKNPYRVMHNGVGTSSKRFVLALKHGRILYWIFGGKKGMRGLWDQSEYERLLKPDEYREIRKTKSRMVDMMGKLGFFSADTYVGDRKLLEGIHLNG